MQTTLDSPDPATLEPTSSLRYSRSKIARLPKPIRDKLNQMLLDGCPYAEIIQQLGPDASHISEQNISLWRSGGHQQWLQELAWREDMRLQSENFSDLANGADPIQLPESGLQLAAIGICQLLRSLCLPGAQPDPDKYVRVANSLARLSRSILQLQEYRDAQARAKTAELKQRDTSKPGTQKEQQLLIDHWRAFFGHDLSEVRPPEPAAPHQPPPTQALPQPAPVRQNGHSADPNHSDPPDEHKSQPANGSFPNAKKNRPSVLSSVAFAKDEASTNQEASGAERPESAAEPGQKETESHVRTSDSSAPPTRALARVRFEPLNSQP